MKVLERILADKRSEVERIDLGSLPAAPPLRPFDLGRARGGPLPLIAEIKRRSPSAGRLSTQLTVAERAAAYERAGASMLSVLTDRTHFDGSYAHLAEARRASVLPLLCKDFVIDERQLASARCHGASAVLLIVRCLERPRLAELASAAREHELVPLVEITNEDELEAALAVDAKLIGVNARDLDTLEMDPARAARVLAEVPADRVAIHLSGLATAGDVARVAATRADAALVGEALMRADDPEPLLREMVAQAGARR